MSKPQTGFSHWENKKVSSIGGSLEKEAKAER